MNLLKTPQMQKGDTIVEVMIAIAVISMVLAGAFSVTQKSSLAVRDSQEHSEMLQLLQGQVEMLRAKALIATDATSGIYASGAYCMDLATGDKAPIGSETDLSTYPAACKGLGRGSLYAVAIHYDPTPATRKFVATGRWDSVRGIQNTMSISYRIAPGMVAAP